MDLSEQIRNLAQASSIPLIRQMSALSHKTSINLGLGQLTWSVDPKIVEAAKPTPSDFLYCPNAGSVDLRKAIAAHYNSNDENRVAVTIGVQEAVYDTVCALKKAGAKKVLIPEIAFGIYAKISQDQGLSVQKFKLTSDFKVHESSLEAQLADQPDVVFLNFPGNPTGVGISDAQQQRLAALFSAYGKPQVISDEIYRDLTFNGPKPQSFASFYPNTIVVDGVSKSGACAGLRVGWAYTQNTDLAKIIVGAGTNVKSCPPTLNQRMALQIVSGETSATIDQYNQKLAANFAITKQYLEEAGIAVPQSTGGFYTFPDLGFADTENFCKELAAKQDGVTMIPGKIFGRPSNVRISFASDRIKEGMTRFAQAYLSQVE